MKRLAFILTAKLLGIHLLVLPLAAEDSAGEESTVPPCCRKELEPSKPLTDGSIYNLESTWTSDFGREIQLRVLRGKPQVVVMFFANCAWACPILVQDLKRIEAALPESIRKETGFLMVTFDSKRDTVEALQAYRKRHELSTDRWTLLRGEPDEVRELAAVLGINFREEIGGQIAHSNLITILDREGEIVRQNKGLNQGEVTAIDSLKRLTSN